MSRTVGIPRGLYYYEYYPMWETFFKELDVKIVLSDHTTKKILDDGVKWCVDEACLPVKVFHGHVANLKDRVDYLFIPRLTSVSRNEYICPKIGGLPDMIRHTFENLPPIIDTEINLRKSNKNDLMAAMKVGSYFSENKYQVREAYQKALKSYRNFKSKTGNGTLPGDIPDNRIIPAKNENSNFLNIAIIGHVYNLYDNYINMNLIYKLRNDGVKIITLDMIDENIIQEKASGLNKKMFWNFGTKAVGGALHLLDRENIDGIIYLMSFGCGIDSFVCDYVERKIRRTSNIPFIVLTIDEHSGEAGMDTRIEAFIDMIRWRKKNETDISAYG